MQSFLQLANRLSRLFGTRSNADTFSKGHKLRQGAERCALVRGV